MALTQINLFKKITYTHTHVLSLLIVLQIYLQNESMSKMVWEEAIEEHITLKLISIMKFTLTRMLELPEWKSKIIT